MTNQVQPRNGTKRIFKIKITNLQLTDCILARIFRGFRSQLKHLMCKFKHQPSVKTFKSKHEKSRTTSRQPTSVKFFKTTIKKVHGKFVCNIAVWLNYQIQFTHSINSKATYIYIYLLELSTSRRKHSVPYFQFSTISGR